MINSKQLFLVSFLALVSLFAYAQEAQDAQEGALNDYYSKKYNPRLSPSKDNINLYLGFLASDDGTAMDLGFGYQWTDRWQLGISTRLLSDETKYFGLNALYTYDAIPSLDGGIFFRIGAEVGRGGYEYYDYEKDIYIKKSNGYIGPVLQLQHQLCDWIGIYTRAKGMLFFNKYFSYSASIGLCFSLNSKKFGSLKKQ